MTFQKSRLITLIVLTFLLMAGSVYSQSSTSGSITGRVTDGSGPLPGVTVELSSPSLQGTRSEVTDSRGDFRFSLLQPGVYTVTSSLSGFSTSRQSDIQVGLGRTVALDVRMNAQLTEQITVTGAAPIVDVTSSGSATNVTSETMESLPLERDFYSVAQLAPGTSEDAFGTAVHGSTSAENQYIIDGLNTTGVELGTEAKRLNFDFIQEVEVLTGGLPAEYGRITGGVVNAITKSGGNEFHGDVFGYAAPESVVSEDSSVTQRPGTTTNILESGDEFDYGFDLGGFLIKDRIWFFGAYNKVDEVQLNQRIQPLLIAGQPTIPAGTLFATDVTRDIYAGKLTFRLSDSQTLTGSLFGDPTESDGVQFAIQGPPSTYLGNRETGGLDYIGRYQGIFSGSLLVNGAYGHHFERDFTSGPGADIPLFIDQSVSPSRRTGGFGFYQNQEFERNTIKLDVSKFLGNHEFKVGGDMEELSAVNANYFSGNGTQTRRLSNRIATALGVPAVYRHIFYINDAAPGFDRTKPATFGSAINFPLTSEPKTDNISAYIQDSWKVRPNLTVNLGFRWEQQEIGARDGSTAIKLDDNYSPRLGFVWDVANNGRSKLYANVGRFYETIPMDINIRAFGGEIQADIYNFSPDPNNTTPDPSFNSPRTIGGVVIPRNRLLGGHVVPVDPNLEGQYIDEALVGYEYEVAPNLAFGVKGTWRDLGNVIEDALNVELGDYFIVNPGKGLGTTAYAFDYAPFPAAKAKREYVGVELTANKRFSNSTQFFASYLWSRLEGNYDGVFQSATGQLDPNINSAYDYADFAVNNEGPLTGDREHQLKFNGSYTFNRGLINGANVGVSAYYQTGTPLNAYGYSNGYRNWEYFLAPRGSLGRNPDSYEMDLQLGYPVRFGSYQLKFLVDVFNLLDRQGITALDQRFNRISDGGCAGVENAAGADICNGDGGILTTDTSGKYRPSGTIPNISRGNAPNPDFLSAGTAFTAPRSFRVGVRFKF